MSSGYIHLLFSNLPNVAPEIRAALVKYSLKQVIPSSKYLLATPNLDEKVHARAKEAVAQTADADTQADETVRTFRATLGKLLRAERLLELANIERSPQLPIYIAAVLIGTFTTMSELAAFAEEACGFDPYHIGDCGNLSEMATTIVRKENPGRDFLLKVLAARPESPVPLKFIVDRIPVDRLKPIKDWLRTLPEEGLTAVVDELSVPAIKARVLQASPERDKGELIVSLALQNPKQGGAILALLYERAQQAAKPA